MHHFSKSTRQLETALRRGGWVAPVGPSPSAMLVRHVDADDELRHPISTIAMIDAGAPWTYPAPKIRIRRSGVKSTATGIFPVAVSLSPARATVTDVAGRRKLVNLGTRNPGNRVDTALEVLDDLRIIGGRPGGMHSPSPDIKCRNGTWTLSRALEPLGTSRILAACACQVGSRQSTPGVTLGISQIRHRDIETR